MTDIANEAPTGGDAPMPLDGGLCALIRAKQRHQREIDEFNKRISWQESEMRDLTFSRDTCLRQVAEIDAMLQSVGFTGDEALFQRILVGLD